MSSILGTLTAHLDSQGLAWEIDSTTGFVTFQVAGPYNQTYSVEARADDSTGRLVARARFPHYISSDDGYLLTHYVRRANLAESIGNLELEFSDDGTGVRFKTSLDFAGTEPSIELVARLLALAVGGIMRHAPNISSVAHGVSTDDALPAPADPFDQLAVPNSADS